MAEKIEYWPRIVSRLPFFLSPLFHFECQCLINLLNIHLANGFNYWTLQSTEKSSEEKTKRFFYLFTPYLQDDRSPLSSGESSDESSSVEVAGPSHHIQEQIVRRQRQPQSQQQASIPANKKQDPQPPPQPIQVRDDLGKAFGNTSSLNSLLYPSSFVNLPQEVLMNLVQSGRLQVEEEGKDFDRIPFFVSFELNNESNVLRLFSYAAMQPF